MPQLERRITHRVEFKPCDLRDVRTMADTVCEIELADDLVRELHRATNGSVGLVRIALERLENLARRRTKRKLQFSDLPEDFEMTSSARSARRDSRRDGPRANESAAGNVVALRASEGSHA
jgi:hypothetical protein